MVLQCTCELECSHSSDVGDTTQGELKAYFRGARKSTNECLLYTGSEQGWQGGKVCTNHIKTQATLVWIKLAAAYRLLPSKFWRSAHFFSLGGPGGSERAKSNSSIYHFQHCWVRCTIGERESSLTTLNNLRA